MLYTLFALLYGIIMISIDLTKTINFPSVEIAAAARKTQIAICTPYILLGAVLLLLLIIHYGAQIKKISIKLCYMVSSLRLWGLYYF